MGDKSPKKETKKPKKGTIKKGAAIPTTVVVPQKNP